MSNSLNIHDVTTVRARAHKANKSETVWLSIIAEDAKGYSLFDVTFFLQEGDLQYGQRIADAINLAVPAGINVVSLNDPTVLHAAIKRGVE